MLVQHFASLDAAIDTLVTAVRAQDSAQLHALFGERGSRAVSAGDAVANEAQRERFMAEYDRAERVAAKPA